jgi:hypothetical protein
MNDYAEAKRRLTLFNEMVREDPGLSAALIGGYFDVLQCQQQWLFDAFKTFRRDRQAALASADAYGPGLRPGLWAHGLLAIAVSLCAWIAMIVRRPATLIFSIDKTSSKGRRDFRMEGVYAFLDSRGERHAEVLHARLGRAFVGNLLKRRKAVVYQESLDFIYSVLSGWQRASCGRAASSADVSAFEPDERDFVRVLLAKCFWSKGAILFKRSAYRALLATTGVRRIFSIDDVRHYHALADAARKSRVPFHAFQHGHFTKYHAGWLDDVSGGGKILPETLFVWSPYWKNELKRLGSVFPQAMVRVGGNPKGDDAAPEAGPYRPPADGETINVLLPYETEAPFAEVAAILKNLSASGRVRIHFKTRPDMSRERQLGDYGLDETQVEIVPDHRAVMDGIHAVAGTYSTFLYDMIAWRKPVFIFDTSLDYGEGMIANGLADKLSSSDDAARLVALCREAATKLEARAADYLKNTGSLKETLVRLMGA